MSLIAAAAVAMMSMLNRSACLVSLPTPNVFEGTPIELQQVAPPIAWDEAIVSWNVKNAEHAALKVEARVLYPEKTTKWYTMADWSLEPGGLRQSTDHQGDGDGNVFTDTLSMKRSGGSLQIRLTGAHQSGSSPKLDLLTISFANTSDGIQEQAPNTAAWGKVIPVPFHCQGDYPNGGVLCSPTSLSMSLDHWAQVLDKPDFNEDVPQVQPNVYDPVFKGHGNWPFNTAYFGSKPGLQGYVSRFNSIGDLEDWIAAGIPVCCSVSWQLMHGRELDKKTESGHLVVLVGFNLQGDPVFNDPGHHDGEAKVYPREDFEAAWNYSHRTVYLLYGQSSHIPPNLDGCWLDS